VTDNEMDRVVGAITAGGRYGGISEEMLSRHLDSYHRTPEAREQFFNKLKNHREVRRYRKSDGTYRCVPR
jgi:hypothetical protein